MDECAGFENRCPERDRGFESLTLRQSFSNAIGEEAGGARKELEDLDKDE